MVEQIFKDIDTLIELILEGISNSLERIVQCKIKRSDIESDTCDKDDEIDENEFGIKCMKSSMKKVQDTDFDSTAIQQVISSLEAIVQTLKEKRVEKR